MIDMSERRYVKLRTDMYADTKFKIIDTKPERDLIHYVWMAIVILAGKVDLEGELYLSKNMPYTIETLAREFNRDIKLVKLALDVLIELQMVEITEHNIYRVKNFAKHQNIKTKKKNEESEEQIHKNKQEVKVSCEKADKQISYIKGNQSEDEININDKDNIECRYESNSKVIDNDNALKVDNIIVEGEKPNDNNTIFLDKEKRKMGSKKKKDNRTIDVTGKENEDKGMFWTEGERHLEDGETLVKKWSFQDK
jgi:predicted phage replisome organizer